MFFKKIDRDNCRLVDDINYITEEPLDEIDISYIKVPANLNPNCVKPSLVGGEIILIEDPDAKKNYDISQRKLDLDAAIETTQLQYFGTTLQTSALRTAITALDMSLNPSAYICSLFPTEADVLSFASSKLNPSRQCAIYCLERIYQFEQEKAAILASN